MLWRGCKAARAEGGYEGTGRKVGLECMVWNSQRANKSLNNQLVNYLKTI